MYTFELVPDSFALLQSLPDSWVTHIITDPPYDAHCQANMCSGSLVGKKSVPKYTVPFEPVESFEFTKHLPRIAQRWGLCFCTVRSLGKIEVATGDWLRGGSFVKEGIWYKPNSMGQLTRDRPASACEGIAVMHHAGQKLRWNGAGSYGMWSCPEEAPTELIWEVNGTRGEPNRHPNQKPLALLLRLITLFTDRGDTVFDPFAGAGRTGEAALLLGRCFIGLELDPSRVQDPAERAEHERWIAAARVRLAAAAERFGSVADADVPQCRFKKGDLAA